METLLSDLKNLSASELEDFIQVIMTLKENKGSPQKSSPPGEQPSVESLCSYYQESGIEDNIIDDALSEINELKDRFQKQGSNRPLVLLIGARYYYSKDTEIHLVPVPFSDAPKVERLVAAFNLKYDTSYNSVLVNKYTGLNIFLPWHKDDEKMLDPNHPIGSLSDGAWRRFQVSLNEDREKSIFEYLLAARSFLVMKPGFHDHFYHQLAKGRKRFANETGWRDSLTLRKVLLDDTTDPLLTVAEPADTEPEVVVEVARVKVTLGVIDEVIDEVFIEEEKAAEERRRKSKNKKPVIEASANIKGDTCDAIIFGSSLVKEIKPNLLAKYGQSFTVVSHSSAHITDVIEDIKRMKDNGNIDCKSVKNIFLVCGGNDVENLPGNHTLDCIYEDFNQLFKLAKDTFINAKINVMSLIPRRVNKYGQEHVYLMHDVNQYLSDNCKKLGIRFVNVYSCYIRRNGRLNKKCFNDSKVHFSPTGNSVLGKFIIAVTYKPRP